MSGGGGVIIEGGGLTAQEKSGQGSNLLRRFVDEGDLLFGRVLQRRIGQQIFNDAQKRVNDSVGLFEVYDICLAAILFDKTLVLSRDDARIVAYAITEKAFREHLQKKLK